jgi:hypothetical protein
MKFWLIIGVVFWVACKKETPCETRKSVLETDFDYVEKDSTSTFRTKHTLTLNLKKNLLEYTTGACAGGLLGTAELQIVNVTNRNVLIRAYLRQSDITTQTNFLTFSIAPNQTSAWQDVTSFYGNVEVPVEYIGSLLKVEYQ